MSNMLEPRVKAKDGCLLWATLICLCGALAGEAAWSQVKVAAIQADLKALSASISEAENSATLREYDFRALEEHVYKIHPRATGYRRPDYVPPELLPGVTPAEPRTKREVSVLKGGPR